MNYQAPSRHTATSNIGGLVDLQTCSEKWCWRSHGTGLVVNVSQKEKLDIVLILLSDQLVVLCCGAESICTEESSCDLQFLLCAEDCGPYSNLCVLLHGDPCYRIGS